MQQRWLARRFLLVLMTVAVLMTSLPLSTPGRVDAGSPVYPDLQAGLPPNIKLRFEEPNPGLSRRWLLRFDGITENHGGLLEVVADLSQSRNIYQQVYDQRVGGSMVQRKQVSTDFIFHPSHNHFHFSNLLLFRLLKKSPTGVYRETNDPSAKTSFCILDTMPMNSSAPPSAFSSCNSSRQGLTADWKDVYGWYLPEQFIDLGATRPADGDYAIEITVDPLDKLLESDNANNVSTAFFSIVDGQTYESSDEPFCSANPSSAKVGERVHVACEHLSPGVTYDMHWQTTQSTPVVNGRGNDDGRVTGSFLVPMSTSGVHTIYVIARGSEKQHTASVQVRTSISASHSSGPVGSRLTVGLTGLSGGEAVTTTMDLGNGTTLKIAQRTAKEDGSSLFGVDIPSATNGAHTVTVTTSRTRKTFKLPFVVAASLKIAPETVQAGTIFYPQLRGFGSNEVVSVVAQGPRQRVLRRMAVYSTGGIGSSSAAGVRIPADLPAGDYVILARGQTTGAGGYDALTVTAPASRSAPTATPTSTATATAVATPTEEPGAVEIPATATTIPVETPLDTETATPSPIETATSTQEPTATEPPTPTEEPIPTETPTQEPTATEAPSPTPEPATETPVPEASTTDPPPVP